MGLSAAQFLTIRGDHVALTDAGRRLVRSASEKRRESWHDVWRRLEALLADLPQPDAAHGDEFEADAYRDAVEGYLADRQRLLEKHS
jgi:hypothetical protein